MTDTERMDWFVQSGACMAFSQDGDYCWLHWPYDPHDEEGPSFNQDGTFDSPRQAIDAQMAKEAKHEPNV